tara:strand:- start:854 stop:2245 length:1392 start_codon:yes stop_codon:yes gene_type:complete
MVNDILIVDDEKDIRSLISGILGDQGIETREAWDSTSAYAEIQRRVPALVLLDIWLQGSKHDGLKILETVRQKYENLSVIMISGHGNIETAVKALHLGAYDFIEKPFETDRLLHVLGRALESEQLKRENKDLRRRAGAEASVIGRSAAINSVRQIIDRVAPTHSRVLIVGPAGSGKEVVARTIHQKSNRAAGPFIVLNAATMAPERMEEELFGIEYDTDQDTYELKMGTLEQAHGGTLLIDQVVDMPLKTQAKILQVLQDQSFSRLGSGRTVKVDVRVIAASSRDLLTAIARKDFREDLYYRLNVVPIELPALRDRAEDLPELIDYFMTQTAHSSGLPARKIAKDAIALMQACDWPGNVRQLRNVVEWLLIMAPGGEGTAVQANMLPPELLRSTPSTLRADLAHEIMSLPLRKAREIFERQYLEAQVARFGNNISKTASFIGMERSALHRKLRSLGVLGLNKT